MNHHFNRYRAGAASYWTCTREPAAGNVEKRHGWTKALADPDENLKATGSSPPPHLHTAPWLPEDTMRL